jgi:hypothetical protein
MKNNEKSSKTEDLLDDINTQMTQKTFLHHEFLTWLWYFAETEGGIFEFRINNGQKKSAQLWIDDRLVLASKTGTSLEHVIKGGTPSRSDEAGLSLASGKTVKEIKIAVDIAGSGLFHATLGSEDISPKSLQLPDLPEHSDTVLLDHRIEATSLFSKALDALFSKFMDERTDKLWDTTRINSIRTWIKTRGHESTSVH